MKVFLTALGCRLNEAELQMWASSFQAMGVQITSELGLADLMVINTCAVTGEAARKSRQTIRKLYRQNPTAKLVVTGCYASLEADEANQLLGVDLLVSNADKQKLPELAKELLEWKSMPFAASEPEEEALFTRNRERAFIKIQDGCRYRCTYCIVTVARGEEKSRPIDELIAEVNQLSASGVKEIVLTGVHVGGYGSDLGVSLADLVVAILEKTQIPRVRFASVEPWDLPDNFFELFRDPRLMPHMHLPIQSGSNRILRLMSRRCRAEAFLALVERARNVVPDFNVTTDIIVGFPGETEEDFELSMQITQQASFGHVHIFSYSNRAGTKAASLQNQITREVKKQRSQKLHLLVESAKQELMTQQLNKQFSVLWEGKPQKTSDGHYRYTGYSENYHKVCMDLDQALDLSNQIMTCRAEGYLKEDGLLRVVPITQINQQAMPILVQQVL